MLPALLAKRVDAIAIYEPIVSAAIAQGARPIGKQYDSIALKFMVASWVAYGPWLATHRDAAVAFAATLNRASQFANLHHEELIPLIAGFTKQDPDVLSKLPYPTVSPTLDAALIQPVIDAAAKYHIIPVAFRAKELIFDGA
jgi:ABC-type nitrate/sulfonate/bicarbonate transport system substrate-binding protein